MKQITFSRNFPATHPKKGQPTYFVEKMFADLADNLPDWYMPTDFEMYEWYEYYNCTQGKSHTIRAGKRWKEGEWFTPKIWSDKPYRSKCIPFSNPIQIKKLYDIEIYPTNEIFINGKFYGSFGSENAMKLANNDGLILTDFRDWFSNLPFSGQILCWNDSIIY